MLTQAVSHLGHLSPQRSSGQMPRRQDHLGLPPPEAGVAGEEGGCLAWPGQERRKCPGAGLGLIGTDGPAGSRVLGSLHVCLCLPHREHVGISPSQVSNKRGRGEGSREEECPGLRPSSHKASPTLDLLPTRP